MKLLYIALVDLNDDGHVGVKKKLDNQLKCFEQDFDTYFIAQTNWFFTTYHKNKLLYKKVLLTLEDIYNEIYEFIKKFQINSVYIRYQRTNKWMNEFLKKLKKDRIKVILEFPTFPYDAENPGSIELEEDKIYRNNLKRYVNMSTNYNGLKSVLGIPSIPIQNGIDVNSIPLKKIIASVDITLIGVATMNFWHGYDRLIKGLAIYYEDNDVKQRVKFVLIGSGPEVSKYQNLINENRLNEYVVLKGTLFGEELDKEYDNADIAVGTLGMYRNNANEASPLKTKEYCARGIPMILGHIDLAFQDNLPFIHNVTNDDSSIDISEIIKFYNNYKVKSTSNDIRAYAEKNLTWNNILVPVKEYFKRY